MVHMYYMYAEGMFKRMESYDMTEGDYVGQSLRKLYTIGDYTICYCCSRDR